MILTVIEQSDDVIHLSLAGRLDIDGVPRVQLKFLGYTAAGKTPVIVDMAGVSMIASLAMGMLVDAARSMTRRGDKLVLVHTQPLVEQALRNARLDKVVALAGDMDEARRLVEPDEPPTT